MCGQRVCLGSSCSAGRQSCLVSKTLLFHMGVLTASRILRQSHRPWEHWLEIPHRLCCMALLRDRLHLHLLSWDVRQDFRRTAFLWVEDSKDGCVPTDHNAVFESEKDERDALTAAASKVINDPTVVDLYETPHKKAWSVKLWIFQNGGIARWR